MELTFNKVGKQYEAEFELSADANLHIEFKNAAPVKLYQRTAGSGWDLVNDVKNAVGKATDVDLTSLIYPKFVKVVCVQEPTYATVTTDGEITEIKSQSKEIEVTANGTTEVTPDAGFSYLSAVKVKTNVAGSGEGGGSSEEKMGMVYLTKEALFQGMGAPMPDTATQEEFRDAMLQLISSFAIVATRRDGNTCDPIQIIWENIAEKRITFDRWDAVAINFDQLMFNKDYGYIPMWKGIGASIEEAKAVVSQVFPNQLTENEFFGRA